MEALRAGVLDELRLQTPRERELSQKQGARGYRRRAGHEVSPETLRGRQGQQAASKDGRLVTGRVVAAVAAAAAAAVANLVFLDSRACSIFARWATAIHIGRRSHSISTACWRRPSDNDRTVLRKRAGLPLRVDTRSRSQFLVRFATVL